MMLLAVDEYFSVLQCLFKIKLKARSFLDEPGTNLDNIKKCGKTFLFYYFWKDCSVHFSLVKTLKYMLEIHNQFFIAACYN